MIGLETPGFRTGAPISSTMTTRPLFWLHIKKSAGVTTRNLLNPYYTEVDRNKKPKCFIQAHPNEYNDILNNYRVVLGDYQFRRCLFAKKFLYNERWEQLYSFAFSREPIDRCISMFWYLCQRDQGLNAYLRADSRSMLNSQQQPLGISRAFDIFLEHVQQARNSNSIYQPFGLHFTTHTATMWDDVTDDSGAMMLTTIFRLNDLRSSLNQVFKECAIEKELEPIEVRLNQNKARQDYTPSPDQMRKIEAIYQHDFEIYESALA